MSVFNYIKIKTLVESERVAHSAVCRHIMALKYLLKMLNKE